MTLSGPSGSGLGSETVFRSHTISFHGSWAQMKLLIFPTMLLAALLVMATFEAVAPLRVGAGLGCVVRHSWETLGRRETEMN